MSKLLEMAVEGKVKPIVTVMEFEKLDEALQKLANFQIGGRVVCRIPT
jgi:D-arabinose 1-dehydrogenase-like Zn-dependent alcohol dehydrogenase